MNRPRLLPPTILLITILVMLCVHFLSASIKIIPSPWNLLGSIFVFPGIVLNLLGDRLFQQAGTTVKPGEESSFLVTTGVFRFSRNPMYLGFALILTGAAVLCGTFAPFLVIPVFIILVEKHFIISEETMLERTFGWAYLEYKEKVRRWL